MKLGPARTVGPRRPLTPGPGSPRKADLPTTNRGEGGGIRTGTSGAFWGGTQKGRIPTTRAGRARPAAARGPTVGGLLAPKGGKRQGVPVGVTKPGHAVAAR
jgi:hypothetical protein